MNKKQFIIQCQKILENFNNGKERLADMQLKVLEVVLEKKFKNDQDCLNAINPVWDAETNYHKKN
jgi:hypothetical protein